MVLTVVPMEIAIVARWLADAGMIRTMAVMPYVLEADTLDTVLSAPRVKPQQLPQPPLYHSVFRRRLLVLLDSTSAV